MIKQYLKQPYPIYESSWKIILAIGLFISFFMVFFEPFGLSAFQSEYRIYVEIGYGVVTALTLLIFYFLIPLLFRKEISTSKWTVMKQIVWQIAVLFTIGFANFLYSSFFFHFSNNVNAFLYYQIYTVLVGIIPIVVTTVIIQNSLLAKNLKIANEYNNSFILKTNSPSGEEKLCLMAENSKDKLEVNSSDLIYITSTGNYIQVFYMKENKLKSILLRNTLKQTEDQLKEIHFMIKCHRAFIVNKNKIVRLKGNSQGLRLVIDGTDEEIPVSRNLSKSLMDVINE
jgi:DNA-binding LytR/AlgR family response regulator